MGVNRFYFLLSNLTGSANSFLFFTQIASLTDVRAGQQMEVKLMVLKTNLVVEVLVDCYRMVYQ